MPILSKSIVNNPADHCDKQQTIPYIWWFKETSMLCSYSS